MAKELPYFKFEPAEYLTKNISFCSLSAQGLFSNICCYYWQRGCSITKDQILRRLNYPNELQELISEGIIDLNGENISIKFLDKQLESAIEISLKNSQNGSKGGRPKKQEESEKKPTALFSESETKAIRRDKIREEEIIQEEIKKDNILLEKETKSTLKKNIQFDFSKSSNEFQEYFLNEFIQAPKQKKKSKELQNKILIDLQSYDEPFAIGLMKKAVLGNYQGYKFDNTDEQYSNYLRKKQNGNNSHQQTGVKVLESKEIPKNYGF